MPDLTTLAELQTKATPKLIRCPLCGDMVPGLYSHGMDCEICDTHEGTLHCGCFYDEEFDIARAALHPQQQGTRT